MQIRISNLNSATTEAEVRRHFADYDVILFSQIISIGNVSKERIKTYCFISIDDAGQALDAVLKLNGSSLSGAIIVVEKSR